MSEQARAEEHLRIIRGLMERATIYRAISAPPALVGGLLSLATAIVLVATKAGDGAFLVCWGAVLTLTGVANLLFIRRDAARRGEPFISSGMKLAVFAILPSILAAAAFTIVLIKDGGVAFLPIPWMIFYGLSLLATGNFAPRSIVFLGWSFLIAGTLALFAVRFHDDLAYAGFLFGSVAMGATFGVFHLIYAACTWPRRES